MKRMLGSYLIFFILFVAAGCRADGGGSTVSTSSSTPSPSSSGTANVTPLTNVLGALGTSFSVAATQLSVGFNGDPSKTKATATHDDFHKFKPTVLCQEGGTGAGDGSVTDRGLDGIYIIKVFYQDCDGMNGSVTISGTFNRDSSAVLFAWKYFEGGLSMGGCSMDPTLLQFDSSVSASGTQNIVSGTLSADCKGNGGDATVRCSWNQTALSDSTALAKGCSCTGNGC